MMFTQQLWAIYHRAIEEAGKCLGAGNTLVEELDFHLHKTQESDFWFFFKSLCVNSNVNIY